MKPRVVQFYFPIFGTLFIPIDKPEAKLGPDEQEPDIRPTIAG